MYLLLDNYDSFTYNIFQYLCELTTDEVKVLRNDETSIQEIQKLNPKAIILSPGPGRPEEAGCMIDVIKAFAGRIPLLGICLGHQAIGYAFGGTIVGAKEIVHGKTQPLTVDGKGIFRGISSPSTFTRYHSLVIEKETLPDSLEITATSPDGEIMGVRHKIYPIEGVQFHPESIASEQGKRLLKNFLNYRRDSFEFVPLMRKVSAKKNLNRVEAESFMEELTEGNLTSAQIAGMLTGLVMKGHSPEEVAGCAAILQKKRTYFPLQGEFLDIVGTGGDEHGTFNISSLSALAAAACGVKVAKHGNRAVSSKSGAADFYSALGFKIDLKPDQAVEVLKETDFTFLFAPVYHGAMKHAAPVRKELGIKTVMNLLGPLVNPAGASSQLIGVYDESLGELIAKAAQLLGVRKALIVFGTDGIDEISIGNKTKTWLLDGDSITPGEIDPAAVGLSGYTLEDLKGGSALENAEMAKELLNNSGRPALLAAVCLNAGAALWLTGSSPSLEIGYRKVEAAFASGLVAKKVDQIRKATQKFA